MDLSGFTIVHTFDRCIDLSRLVDVLLEHLSHSSVQTRVAVLKWVHHLHTCMPDKVGSLFTGQTSLYLQVFKYMDRLFPVLLKIISDTSDEVVQHMSFQTMFFQVVLLDVEVLSAICSQKSDKFSLKDLKLSAKCQAELTDQSGCARCR